MADVIELEPLAPKAKQKKKNRKSGVLARLRSENKHLKTMMRELLNRQLSAQKEELMRSAEAQLLGPIYCNSCYCNKPDCKAERQPGIRIPAMTLCLPHAQEWVEHVERLITLGIQAREFYGEVNGEDER